MTNENFDKIMDCGKRTIEKFCEAHPEQKDGSFFWGCAMQPGNTVQVIKEDEIRIVFALAPLLIHTDKDTDAFHFIFLIRGIGIVACVSRDRQEIIQCKDGVWGPVNMEDILGKNGNEEIDLLGLPPVKNIDSPRVLEPLF